MNPKVRTSLAVEIPSPWRRDTLAALSATSALVPVALALAFVAYGGAGTLACELGLRASLAGMVLGGLAMAAAGRSALPAASPSAPTTLIFGSFIAALLADPALHPTTADGAAQLLALAAGTVVLAGLMMVVLGRLQLGTLARQAPQPVLAGFMNGVAVLLFLSQLPAILGLPAALWQQAGLAALPQAQGASVVAALLTAAATAGVARAWPRAPAGLLALVAGGGAFAALQAAGWVSLPTVGALPLPWPRPDTVLAGLQAAPAGLLERHGAALLLTATLIALAGALESVLSLVIVDQALGTRSDVNRELQAVGLANIVSGACGGLPVVYMRLRAMTTLNAGGRSARSLVIGSAMLAAVFLLAGPLVARLPLAVLAGIIIMVAWGLSDRWTRQLLQQWFAARRAGLPHADLQSGLAVVALVAAVTWAWGFAVGVVLGTVLSVLLFMRTMSRSLVRARCGADTRPSRRIYPDALEAVLRPLRGQVEVVELEGALFFGNAERLDDEARRRPAQTRTLVFDLRRVSTLDASAAIQLKLLAERLAHEGVALHLAGVSADNRHGLALRTWGAFRAEAAFVDADHAVEAAELALLAQAGHTLQGLSLPLAQCALADGLDTAQLERLARHLRERRLAAGERLFREGEPGDRLFVLAEGSISVKGAGQRLVSFSPGMTLGETALLDGGGRTADAVADLPSHVYELSAEALRALQAQDPGLGAALYRNLARHLAERLRGAATAWRHAAG